MELEEIKRMTDEGEPLNEAGDNDYQEAEKHDQISTDAQMPTEYTVRLNEKLQLVDGCAVVRK